ncbi:MAG: FAD-dependent oxidoreductase [Pseudomonadota bacterium]|mgnify:CR=1 FL=1
MRYVIVGAGPAGVVAAETIRGRDAAGDIALIGDEPGEPYSRMAIPYVLTGHIGEAGALLRKTKDHYRALGIRYVPGRAAKLDRARKELALADGTKVPFDRLLIATGAHAIKPPVPGLDLPGVHHCWTMADARAIAKRAGPGAEVVLVGAGFIGCIILESLVERGVRLAVVESENRMLPKMMDEAGGDMIERWCDAKGVKVLTATRLKGVEKGKGDRLAVALDPGGTVPADLVVVATGVKANTDFLAGSDLELEGGVRVDDRLVVRSARASPRRADGDAIFAAGDCAQGPDFSGGFMVHAIQPTAAEHGRIAGVNMTGGDARYKGSLIMNVLDTAGLISASFGHWDKAEEARAVDVQAFKYVKLAFAGDRLVGALTIGRTDHIGAIRGLIQTRAALGSWKAKLMRDPTRVVEAFVASSCAPRAQARRMP